MGRGNVAIVRQVDAETGEAHTLVRDEDGSSTIFDENAVITLAREVGNNGTHSIKNFTHKQLRGLMHEAGQRLVHDSQLYHGRLAELRAIGERLDYRFFGLDSSASEKDLDSAYRRLAKQMHPDKNGGTEEAKLRFQGMKERYEALRRRRSKDIEGQRQTAEGTPESEGDVSAEAAENAQQRCAGASPAAQARMSKEGEESIVIGITGCSCSGKGWVSKELLRLVEAAGRKATIISQGEFLFQASQMEVNGQIRMSEAEPECTNHEKFAAAIKERMDTHDVVIAAGVHLVYDPHVTALLSHIFFINLERDEARRRRTQPQDATKQRNPLECRDFDELLWPAHERYMADRVAPLGARVVQLQSPEDTAQRDEIVHHIMHAVGLVAAEGTDEDQKGGFTFDPEDRASMERAAAKMLGSLLNITVQMKALVKELARARTLVSDEDG